MFKFGGTHEKLARHTGWAKRI